MRLVGIYYRSARVGTNAAPRDPACPLDAVGSRVLTDAEAEDIRRGLAARMRGPVLVKWCEQLLADRKERLAQERAQRRRPWRGPLAGPRVSLSASTIEANVVA